jgi:hypothetical protein
MAHINRGEEKRRRKEEEKRGRGKKICQVAEQKTARSFEEAEQKPARWPSKIIAKVARRPGKKQKLQGGRAGRAKIYGRARLCTPAP